MYAYDSNRWVKCQKISRFRQNYIEQGSPRRAAEPILKPPCFVDLKQHPPKTRAEKNTTDFFVLIAQGLI